MKALELRHLAKRYPNGVEALKGVDLVVEEGDFFALLGPNGAGKSTAIGIISSLVRKSAGEALIFGHEIDREPWQAKASIGLVPQEFNFNGFETATQIVVNQAGFYGVPRRIARQRAEVYLKELGLWEKRDTVSRALSGGMKRRLMIARALIHEPRLLILDEPTAGVDIELRRSMLGFLRKINEQGTTIILTTHYLEEAELLCRNVAIIDDGRIIENTDIKSLLRQLNTHSFILDLQAALAEPPQVEGYSLRRLDDSTLEAEVGPGQSLTELFARLAERGVYVGSMKNKSNRLEEMFVRLLAADKTEHSGGAGA
ncbi:ABC transporter ATP-binding protein [Alkalilimnicola sp. S0819]|uniref:ABC transporter ATP-binding protein n=1 Tax=Alkalilimnicola sp. S0819 TaxID=2613922 RepID=UPI00126201A2|nr:ABC transporter ATP-binding protein [Alkalilimnicola sp. S0819]KAB7628413.1 ABC transporter ATP-binding protein [Alkalilimnicola sp. S0819]MPQ15316.1 ATP-binding cassette domain-containing protein [Alkalilimnicola sp. S0819]